MASHTQHSRALEEDEYHWSLEDYNRVTWHLPDTLGSASILPYDSEHRSRQYDWPKLFEGRVPGAGSNDSGEAGGQAGSQAGSVPATVCLACSNQLPRTEVVQYDIDSLIGFAQSLAFIRRGLFLNLTPHFSQNIQTNVHLTIPIIKHLPSNRART